MDIHTLGPTSAIPVCWGYEHSGWLYTGQGFFLHRVVGGEDKLLYCLPTRTVGTGAWKCTFGSLSVEAVLPAGALRSPVRLPLKQKKNTMKRCASHRPAAQVAEHATTGVVLRLFVVRCVAWEKNMMTRRATHPPAVPVVERVAEGG